MAEASDSRGQVGRHGVHMIVEPAPALEELDRAPTTPIAPLLVRCGALLLGAAILGTSLGAGNYGMQASTVI